MAVLQFLVFTFSWLAPGVFYCRNEAVWNTIPRSEAAIFAPRVDYKLQTSIQYSFERDFNCGCNNIPCTPKGHSFSHCVCFCCVFILGENPIKASIIAPPSLYNYLAEQARFIPQNFSHAIERPPRLS
jgi:hypothetical protein